MNIKSVLSPTTINSVKNIEKVDRSIQADNTHDRDPNSQGGFNQNKKNSKTNDAASKYTLKKNTIAVVTDGSSVLGLGNIGASAAIPVMEGKAVLMKHFAGVDAFPICLNTEVVEEIIKTVKYLEPVFGVINLEDISAPRCFEIEEIK